MMSVSGDELWFVCMSVVASNEPSIQCHMCKCLYHIGNCSSVTKSALKALTADQKNSWTCTTCTVSKRRSGHDASEVTLQDVLVAVQQNGAKVDSVLQRVINIETRLNKTEQKCDSLEKHAEAMEKRVVDLEKTVNYDEQYSRRCNLEIHGVPYSKGEDLLKVIMILRRLLVIPSLIKKSLKRITGYQ